MSAITIGGDLVHYEKLGRGRPVILAHGWIGSWRYWIPLMQTLHLYFTVYTIDFVGFGDSAKNDSNYTIDAQVKMLEQFMASLGIPKAAMIGHGLGAMVMTQFALRNPTKVARLMLASMPLFAPSDLKERVPAGTSRLLTPGNTRYSLAPSVEEVTGEKISDGAGQAAATIASSNTPVTGPLRDDKTVASGSHSALHELPTIGRPDNIDRDALRKAAEARDKAKNQTNHLYDLFKGNTMVSLLEKCFKKTEGAFDKLKVDVEKSDNKVLLKSAEAYEAGAMLDDLRRVTAPIVAVHGQDDPVFPAPGDDIWDYLTTEKDDVFMPIPLPSVRHFPMLEHDAFPRLAKDFLDVSDISKLEIRERWVRRHR